MAIHRLPVRGTNCYLIGGAGGSILVDPGPPGVAPNVAAGAAAAGITPGDVRLILVTHGHLDHYGAAPQVQGWCGAPVAASLSEPEFSRDRRNALPPGQTLRSSLVRWIFLLLSPFLPHHPLEADLLLESGADLSPYGVEARTLLLPGHSPGSLGILTAAGDAFVGDLFVNYLLPSKPLYLLDGEAWQRSYDLLRDLQPRTIYVGHGEPFSGKELAKIYPARYQFRWWVR